MGLYLLTLASIDLSHNAVFHRIISGWTGGIPCFALGLVSFISSEASLLILTLLSLARVLTVQKVGGMVTIESKVRNSCIIAWCSVILAGAAYVLYLLTQSMRVRNNMCILLGISHQRFVSWAEELFQMITIVFNVMVLMLMIISKFAMFVIVRRCYQLLVRASGQSAKSQTRLVRTGLMILLLLVCNVLTWLPLLTVSALLLCGTDVHENALQWVAVLGLPICACTDPILYNLASLRTYMSKRK